jgi:hypothetical protein
MDKVTVPTFHTFREMSEHIANGGAAYRWGSHYPIYCNNPYRGIEKRFDGGSAGECIDKAHFSPEEQQSSNWVLISAEDWKARDEALAEAYKRCAALSKEKG